MRAIILNVCSLTLFAQLSSQSIRHTRQITYPIRPNATAPVGSGCSVACAEISESLPGQVFLRQSGAFSYWDQKQAELVPACRVEPEDETDVTVILKAITEERCWFAIKSGGHARAANASNAEYVWYHY